MIYDFVVQKPGDRNTKNLNLQALFAQTKLLNIEEENIDDKIWAYTDGVVQQTYASWNRHFPMRRISIQY